MTRFAWLCLVGCARVPGPIVPSALPAAAETYEDAGRSFAAPHGDARFVGDDAEVVYPGPAKLTVTAIGAMRGVVAESNVEDALHRIPALGGRPLMKEESPGVGIFCIESEPPSRVAACARLDDETRRGGPIVLTTFIADAKTYAALGGVRVPAEAARTAKGFRAPEALPSVR